MGQNDAHPRDFMALDYDSAEAQHWRARYVDFVHALREKYPKALIVLTTTIVRHDAAWDRAISEVCDKLRTEGEFHVKHFCIHATVAARMAIREFRKTNRWPPN